jgi:hypothetical protein
MADKGSMGPSRCLRAAFSLHREAFPIEGTRMTQNSELDAFQAVCQRLGLRFTLEPHAADNSFLNYFVPTVSQQAQWCLSFGQNHLYFDMQGRFLGTLGDENGAWEPRALNVPYTAVDVDEEYPR